MFGFNRKHLKPARIGAYLAGDLGDAACRKVEAHVEECGVCARGVARMRAARQLLLDDVVDRPPEGWEQIDAGVRAAIRVSSAIDGIARDELEPRRGSVFWWMFAPVAAAAAALTLAYTFGLFGEPPPTVRVTSPSVASATPAPGETVFAVVNLREGPDAHVSFGPDRDAPWRVLALGEPLPEGTRLRTVSGARLGMQLGSDDRFVLSGDAEVELRLMDSARKEVRLHHGSTVSAFDGVGSFRVSTLDHDVIASGDGPAMFSVRRDADHTVLEVWEGVVAVSSVGRPDVVVTVTALSRVSLPHHVDLGRRTTSVLGSAEVEAVRAMVNVPVFASFGTAPSRDTLATETGLVLLHSDEPGAEVRVGGVIYGMTNLVLRLTIGRHDVAFYRGGIETHALVVDVVPGGKLQPIAEKVVDPRRAIRAAVKERVRDYMPRLRGCYERVLKREPDLAGRVVIHFTVEPDGRVSSAEALTDTVPTPVVSRCLVGEMEALNFGALKDGKPIAVRFPFLFSKSD